ncbi:hypothetical protein HDU85_000069 [Gaertneriomyces sp. JEL0708]|nr:hypothetical protein HDU85_000069 [Gaertneriomyces sp. JEL0708]
MASFSGVQQSKDLATTWSELVAGIDQIMNNLSEGLSYKKWMELYTSRMNAASTTEPLAPMNVNRGANLMGADLYSHLKTYLKTHLQTLNLDADTTSEEELLLRYVKEWDRYTSACVYVNHIFRYLNRHWVKREIDEGQKDVYEVYTLTLVTWRDYFFHFQGHGQGQTKLMSAVLRLIQKQRDGETIDTSLVKKVSESFVALGLDETDTAKGNLEAYKTYFEAPFLAKTETYYRMESEKFISENTITDYMKKAEARLIEEENRVQMYLHSDTQKPLISTCVNVLIKSHTGPIQEEFQTLLDQDKLEDLSRMYGLLSRVPESLDKLRQIFETHVRKQGLSTVEKVAESAAEAAAAEDEDEDEDAPKKKSAKKKAGEVDPKNYVDALLVVHQKFAKLCSDAFKDDTGFVASLDKACREFVNRNKVCRESSSKSPELLAKYADAVLRKSNKVAEENGMENALNNVMTVFRYVEDKDVFQKFYQMHLSKRLVFATSVSDDMEETMISKLKEACGFEFTSKLQRMFTDVGVSKDLNDQFRQQMDRTHDKEDLTDFYILVGGTAQWPLHAPNTHFNLPDDLLKTYERFQQFYSHKHTGRKLNWLFQHAKGEVKTHYVKAGKTPYTLLVTLYQLGILLQFNTATSYTHEELEGATGLNEDVLKGQLGTLVKSKLLLSSNGKIGPGSKYDLNMQFKSKKLRIKLDQPVRTEQKQESDSAHKNVEEDRKMVIQAAIVRIMKTRKAMNHSSLIAEVIQQLAARFKPQVPDIKKCIDILLEKEYIERMEDQKDMYSYIA